jgi:hypothetical protein
MENLCNKVSKQSSENTQMALQGLRASELQYRLRNTAAVHIRTTANSDQLNPLTFNKI